MFGSEALEIGIGLIFVYLLLSLACTAGTELLSALFKIRARELRKGIKKLVADEELTRQIYEHPLIKSLYKLTGPSHIPSHTFALVLKDLLASEAVDAASHAEDTAAPRHARQFEQVRKVLRVLTEESEEKKNREARAAQAALTLELARTGTAPDDIKDAIDRLAEQFEVDVSDVVEKLEDWFNTSMERVSGWYKRWAKTVSFIIALVVVGFSNADSLQLARTLSQDTALRESLVEQATVYAQQQYAPDPSGAQQPAGPADQQEPVASDTTEAPQPASSALAEAGAARDRLNDTMQQIYGLGLPFGWRNGECYAWFGWSWLCTDADEAEAKRLTAAPVRSTRIPPEPSPWMKLAGLLTTTLALTLGAPFWFDILGKVVTIRSGGKTASKGPETGKKGSDT